MIANTPEPIVDVLREIGEVGGEGTYLVGGFVRDLLLDRPSLDIDIVVEGDAIQVAEAMCDRWRGTLEVHPNSVLQWSPLRICICLKWTS